MIKQKLKFFSILLLFGSLILFSIPIIIAFYTKNNVSYHYIDLPIWIITALSFVFFSLYVFINFHTYKKLFQTKLSTMFILISFLFLFQFLVNFIFWLSIRYKNNNHLNLIIIFSAIIFIIDFFIIIFIFLLLFISILFLFSFKKKHAFYPSIFFFRDKKTKNEAFYKKIKLKAIKHSIKNYPKTNIQNSNLTNHDVFVDYLNYIKKNKNNNKANLQTNIFDKQTFYDNEIKKLDYFSRLIFSCYLHHYLKKK